MDIFVSYMRMAVPLFAGWALSVVNVLGIHADSKAVAGGVALVLAGGYYVVFRAVEAYAGRIGNEPLRKVAGVLLGYARPPQYDKPAVLPAPTVPRSPQI